MSKDPKEFRAEEKKAIVEEAIAAGKRNVEKIADKHEISVELLHTWIREQDVTYVFEPDAIEDEESVELQVTDEFANDYEFGATPDHLNYPRLAFWGTFGTLVILLMIFGIFSLHNYTFQSVSQLQSSQSTFYDIDTIKERDRVTLDSFGVVDLEAGIYRMPIDSVISQMATDSD